MNPGQHPKDDALDLLALGAAGALSREEYRTLDELLAGDPELAGEYHALQAGAATLAEAASEAPPTRLRASVREAIEGVQQLPRSEPIPRAYDGPSNVVPIHRRRWVLPATVAAAVLVLLAGGVVVRNVVDAPSDQMAEVLNDDEAVTIELTGALDGLRIVASDREDAAVLLGSGLHRPEPGMVFQLWAIHDEAKQGMGTFMPAETGEVAMMVDGAGVDAEWAVTMEPEGGSAQPTSEPVAVSPGLA